MKTGNIKTDNVEVIDNNGAEIVKSAVEAVREVTSGQVQNILDNAEEVIELNNTVSELKAKISNLEKAKPRISICDASKFGITTVALENLPEYKKEINDLYILNEEKLLAEVAVLKKEALEFKLKSEFDFANRKCEHERELDNLNTHWKRKYQKNRKHVNEVVTSLEAMKTDISLVLDSILTRSVLNSFIKFLKPKEFVQKNIDSIKSAIRNIKSILNESKFELEYNS